MIEVVFLFQEENFRYSSVQYGLMAMVIQVGQLEHNCSIYGPHQRTGRTQGCTLGCKGCWNQDLWTSLVELQWMSNRLFKKPSKRVMRV